MGNIEERLKKIFFNDYRESFFEKYYYIKSHNNIKSKIYRYKLHKIQEKFNSGISLCSNIKGKIVLPHGLNGIFISQGATIGKNCVIFHQVTIGSNTLKDSKNKGAPTIGDNCYIGVGAKIIGNVTIGKNVRIGANCVVTKDIPDNATVVLGENRIIFHDTPRNNKFYEYNIEMMKNENLD